MLMDQCELFGVADNARHVGLAWMENDEKRIGL